MVAYVGVPFNTSGDWMDKIKSGSHPYGFHVDAFWFPFLKKISHLMSARDFTFCTGFSTDVHCRLRRFSTFVDYCAYIRKYR